MLLFLFMFFVYVFVYLSFSSEPMPLYTGRSFKCRRNRPGAEVINIFSCSTQLSTKFQQLIKTKMMKNKDFSCFKTLRFFYHANKC